MKNIIYQNIQFSPMNKDDFTAIKANLGLYIPSLKKHNN
jgi:hypothetical protein